MSGHLVRRVWAAPRGPLVRNEHDLVIRLGTERHELFHGVEGHGDAPTPRIFERNELPKAHELTMM